MPAASQALLGAAICLGVYGQVLAGTAEPAPALCLPGETIVFSCSTGSKRVSLCEAGSPAGSETRLSYRYGRAGDPPDLSYQAETGERSAFQAGTMPLSGGGGSWIEFTRHRHRYVVFSFWVRGEGEVSGVAVERSGRRLTTLSCQHPAVSKIGPDYFSSARLPTAKQDFLP